jgi:hypothetical protein
MKKSGERTNYEFSLNVHLICFPFISLDDAGTDDGTKSEKGLFATLPKSLKAEVLVRSRLEDPEVQQHRAKLVKAKSVHELSQISSVADIPLPRPLENLVNRPPRPVERKKRFREKYVNLTKHLLLLVYIF